MVGFAVEKFLARSSNFNQQGKKQVSKQNFAGIPLRALGRAGVEVTAIGFGGITWARSKMTPKPFVWFTKRWTRALPLWTTPGNITTGAAKN